MTEGRVSPHSWHLAVTSRAPISVVVITAGGGAPQPGCPETPHGAPVQRPCYGRENITVSRPLKEAIADDTRVAQRRSDRPRYRGN